MNSDNISWDQYFMGIAILSSFRSKDPNTQVGACVVGQDKRILSVGYNGAPNGYDDKDFPWDVREGNFEDTKYPYICHAELNAILNYRGNMRDMQNSTLYVRFFPCNECAKIIIQSGIKHIIYWEEYEHDGHVKESNASKKMFNKCGVQYEKISQEDIQALKRKWSV